MNSKTLTMTRNTALAMFVFAVAFCASPVKADMLFGYFYDSNFSYRFDVGSYSERNQLSEILGQNLTTGQELQFYCANFRMRVTNDFKNPGIGQQYTGTSLANSAALNDRQKGALQSLFNHVYSPLLNAQTALAGIAYDYRGTEWNAARDAVDVLNSALQLAVWEIIHETGNTWGITTGSFQIYSPWDESVYRYSTLSEATILNQLKSLTDSWFASINSEIWTGPFAEETLYELTYFTSVGATSQPLIAVTGQSSDAAVPEPATILLWILGTLGAIGTSFARRRVSVKKPTA